MAPLSFPVPPLPKSGQLRAFWRAPASSTALAWHIACAAAAHRGPLLVVARDNQSAHQIEADLHTLLAGDGSLPVVPFPDWETLPYDQFSPHPDIISQRLSALHRLPTLQQGIVVVPVQTLMQRVAPLRYIVGGSFDLRVGQRLDLEAEKRRLESAGYRNVPQVMDPGDFAVRGGLLDVYPMGADTPLRIELLDEDIDSIRAFDPESQRSLDHVQEVKMLPGREVPMDDVSVERVLATLRERFDVDTRRSALYQDLKARLAPSGIEYYLPLFFQEARSAGKPARDATATLFDYLGETVLPLLAPGVGAAADAFWAQTQNRYEQRRHDVERPLLAPEELYQAPDTLREKLNGLPRIEVWAADHARIDDAQALGDQPLPPLPVAAKDAAPAEALKSFLGSYAGRVLIAADSPGRREALLEVLAAAGLKPEVIPNFATFLAAPPGTRWREAADAGTPRAPSSAQKAAASSASANAAQAQVAGGRSLPPPPLPQGEGLASDVAPARFAIAVAPLDDGFALDDPYIAVLTERQLFPERAGQPRRTRRAGREPEAIIRDLGELTEGAPIVHEDHGVGRYRGLIVLDAGGMPGEFLEIEYAKGDRLYVPVAQLHLISRYSGASADTAPLHSLGGEQWSKAKRRAAEKVRDVAAELLEIQARRRARAGLALQVDRAMYEPFAAGFPFEETADQLAAIEATLRDLASSQPMDRVVCGDVGFGKTEVAVRAAFAAASAGKQVAVLVPTTLLAEQHYRNFRDRFADWPLRVEVLSRFKSAKEIKAELEKVADGGIDVIIGTHRLLQPDVKFKDLGLVVVDEEQRFGVRQKEALKALRANVHLLTLTATPIPRTLNMAMAGLRDLSIIATAPPNRLAVQTFVTAWDNALLREAFQRELARGGQLYFLHNDVESIGRMQRELSELVPEARIGIAHGQMPERELERVMLDFQKQRFNVLLSTTIIESGIDIPNANTIVINRADRFGLAQLHQLRGRVGRSHHRAYAYLLVPDRRSITGDAQKRLDAIASMDELGAGFTLATHDLEIRGAGELLGEDQSGQMAEVGFSLYTELLERAVRSIRQGKLPDLDAGEEARGAEVELHVPALIPDDYLPDVHTRLTLYKRISSARDSEQLRELQVEMIDRFGLLPEAVKHLFAVAELKLQANTLGIRKLELGENGGRIVFESKPDVDPMTIIQMIQKQPKLYAMDGPDKLKVKLPLPEAADRFNAARGLLAALSPR
ncbi:transcription-repair coupling factor [Xanthomonas translucens]|uniref:Transcription-repair-coupling factor n=6 Tax=Xanthomonas campestris pv. translucens TaxID=343 RepID=A0A120EYU7_XANCT|nr:transcription-repair coupling factor [Xanthomonas translucens]AKK68275.1 transcription-repair coupling factor [Xanthomonas translucens pv. undulosa]KWV16597.1 transcription-repair coupling factor [Xanthomonas translucens]MCS3361379.1 transcription-repair coupling factor [Xanthomonas translucens pv. translucens]MCS3375094.1 transcription-repair coupling factor [Xanthomonas translucens pv. translucens]MCT8271289.1 transcription-repair coupling factor [Xanthomonas translucens pv. undulosa]